MEILTPQIIWKGYDASILPLGTTVLSDKREGALRTLTAYFNGSTTTEGVVRVFVRCVIPLSARKPMPAVILMKDADEAVPNIDVSEFTDRGYAVFLPDFAGERDDDLHYTLYPQSMSYANYRPSCLTEMPNDLRYNCWIAWAEVAMRTMTFACSLEDIDGERVAIVGEGISVAAVIKSAAVDARFRCAATVFSSGFRPNENDKPNYLKYEVALSNGAYASMIKLPILIMIASNELDGSSDRMSDMFAQIPPKTGSRFSVSERASHVLGVKQRNNLSYWLSYYLHGKGSIPDTPTVTAECVDHALYYRVQAPESCDDVELFIARVIRRSEYRHWSRIHTTEEADGCLSAHVDIFDVRSPVYAFVNACGTDGGMSVSSPVLTKLPGLLGVAATPLKTTRMLYDSSMGTDDWIALAPEADRRSVFMMEGPLGIEGVASRVGTMSTYKLSAAHCRGEKNSLLQMMICAERETDVVFTVAEYDWTDEKADKYTTYSYRVHLNPADKWTRLTLAASEFKSSFSVCSDWSNVVYFRVDSEALVAIASMVWV